VPFTLPTGTTPSLKYFYIAISLGISFLLSQPCLEGKETAEVMVKGKYEKMDCTTLSDLDGFKGGPQARVGRYGGWREKRLEGTGFFRVEKTSGRWWAIDPEGYPLICMGVNSVSPQDGGPDTLASKATLLWGKGATGRLRKFGFNTAGCWSASEVIQELERPIAYCLRWNISSQYRNHRRAKYPATGKFPVLYPFDPEFEATCEKFFAEAKSTKEDPWLFGHFSDNELPFREKGIVDLYLSHPEEDPNHLAAKKFLKDRKVKKAGWKEDRDFLELVVDTYYRKVANALKKNDPSHLYLGTRFHGRALHSEQIFKAAGKHTDVISVNYYHRWTPEKDRIENWSSLANKPILITEWYAMAEDSDLPVEGFGAGFAVRTQVDRAKFYQHFSLGLLQNPSCIGWHWFKYRDSLNNAGIVDNENEPYDILWDSMKQIHHQAYSLVTYFDQRKKEEKSKEQ
jgi:hypothetical protein